MRADSKTDGQKGSMERRGAAKRKKLFTLNLPKSAKYKCNYFKNDSWKRLEPSFV